MVLRVASFFPFEATYYLNGHSFIENELNREGVKFRKDDNAFLSVSSPAALQTAADRFTADTIRERPDYWTLILGPEFSKHERSSIPAQRNLLQQPVGLRPEKRDSITLPPCVRSCSQLPTASQLSRRGGSTFMWDFPLLQKLALPITVGTVRFPGVKIQDTRMIRLMEVLLHNGTTVAGWRSSQIHAAVLATFGLTAERHSPNQLRYDLRKLKGHGLAERDGRRYAYCPSDKASG